LKIIGYVRLSRASREESTSIVRQREIVEQTCNARGLELIEIVEDVDVSASKKRLDRKGLHRVRAILRAGEADAVMVWRLDRLVRSVADVGVLLDEGMNIISATEALDTTLPMGRAMVEILQVFASMEAKTIGIRIAASQAHLRRVGRFPGGVVPYGYRVVPHPDGVGRALEPHPAEAAIVRRMADEVLAGDSIYAVAKRLNIDDVPTRRADKVEDDGTITRRQWAPTTIKRILRSDAVLGRVRVDGLQDAQGRTLQKARPLTDDDGMPVEVWAPLLSIEEVERLRAITEWKSTPGRSEATKAGKRNRATRMLSGLLMCAGCGNPLIAKNRQRTTGNDIYACGASAHGLVCPRGVSVECERVEAEVARKFLAVAGRMAVVEQVTTVREVAGLAAIEEAIRTTTDDLRAPGADLGELMARLTKLHSDRERLSEAPTAPTVEMVETGETFAQRWASLDAQGRRRLLISAGVEIGLAPARQRGKWDPERVSVEWPLDYAQ